MEMTVLETLQAIVTVMIIPLGLWVLSRMDKQAYRVDDMGEKIYQRLGDVQSKLSDHETATARDYVQRRELPAVVESAVHGAVRAVMDKRQ